MKIWKRNLVIAGALLVVCAGVYVNWLQGQSAVELSETLDADVVLGEDTMVMGTAEAAEAASRSASLEELETVSTTAESFAELRLTRQSARDSAINLLQETISYGEDTERSEASGQLNGIVSDALTEAQIESLVGAKGYADCVAYLAEDVISVAVPAPEDGLSAADVAVISDIVTTQTGCTLDQVRIIEVK